MSWEQAGKTELVDSSGHRQVRDRPYSIYLEVFIFFMRCFLKPPDTAWALDGMGHRIQGVGF